MPRKWSNKRKTNNRGEVKKRVLIVCEGKKTEPNYFNSLKNHKRLRTVEVDVKGDSGQHSTVVEKAIKLSKEKSDYNSGGISYDHVWCVIDVDGQDDSIIQKAFSTANKNKIEIALSNPSFELWYFLHYSYSTKHATQKEILRLTKDKIQDYDKTMDVYKIVLEKQKTAMVNAKKLQKHHQQSNNSKYPNPLTSAHKLVELLNQLAD